jgi:hypothetical protein
MNVLRGLLLTALVLCASPVHAAIACSELTQSSAATGISKTTASISPTANELILVYVSTTGQAGGTVSASGASMTWDRIGNYWWDTSSDRYATILRAQSASPGSGALTLTATSSASGWFWAIWSCSGTLVGNNGADAIIANANSLTSNAGANVTSGSTTGLSVTLSALSNANNATFGFARTNGSITVSAGSGYTGIGTSTSYKGEYKTTGSTTVNVTWSNAVVIAGLVGLEVAPASGGTAAPNRGTLLGVR